MTRQEREEVMKEWLAMLEDAMAILSDAGYDDHTAQDALYLLGLMVGSGEDE